MKRLDIALAALASVLIVAAQASAAPDPIHAVYTMTNSLAGNAVLAFSRAADGSLTQAGTFPTGAIGCAPGSGHAIVVSRDRHDVVAVNAGSTSITAFEAQHDGLHQIGTFPSGGVRPTSVTIDEDVVYVLNADPLSIAGFQLSTDTLTPIAGSIQALGAGAATPSQIQFDHQGKVLVVDDRGSNTSDTFVVDSDGVAGPAVTSPAAAGGPFGFDFDRAGHLLVPNTNPGGAFAGMAGASSYFTNSGTLTPNGAGVPSGQAASCWLAARAAVGGDAARTGGRVTPAGSPQTDVYRDEMEPR